jgi:hypothetical protein
MLAEEISQHAKPPDAGIGAAEPRQPPVVQLRLRVVDCVDQRRTRGTDRALADQMVIVQPVLGYLGTRFELGD